MKRMEERTSMYKLFNRKNECGGERERCVRQCVSNGCSRSIVTSWRLGGLEVNW